MSFRSNLKTLTDENSYFRHVIFTGKKSQLVVMSVPPGGEVGDEVHGHVEQTLYFQSGSGESILDGEVQTITAGDVVIVTPGTKHNFKNTGTEPLKVATVYVPANHIDGRVHITKADADADSEDEAFGESNV